VEFPPRSVRTLDPPRSPRPSATYGSDPWRGTTRVPLPSGRGRFRRTPQPNPRPVVPARSPRRRSQIRVQLHRRVHPDDGKQNEDNDVTVNASLIHRTRAPPHCLPGPDCLVGRGGPVACPPGPPGVGRPFPSSLQVSSSLQDSARGITPIPAAHLPPGAGEWGVLEVRGRANRLVRLATTGRRLAALSSVDAQDQGAFLLRLAMHPPGPPLADRTRLFARPLR
jgi:hypothetical protein